MVVGGSLSTIFGKIINKDVEIEVEEDGELIIKEIEFNHPMVLNLMMFSGEVLLLILLQFTFMKDRQA